VAVVAVVAALVALAVVVVASSWSLPHYHYHHCYLKLRASTLHTRQARDNRRELQRTDIFSTQWHLPQPSMNTFESEALR